MPGDGQARTLDGRSIADDIREHLQERVARLRPRLGRVPGPAVVLVGSDAASRIHVRKKRGVCERVAIRSGPHDLPVGTTQEELLKLVDEFNADASAVDGILVQMPLSANIDDETVIEHIAPKKDVEGFHPFNIGRLATKLPALRLCTPRGVMKLLGHTRNIHQGQHAVVVGSNHVGRPMSLELLAENCTVTTCHVYTQDLPQYVAGADVLVVAGGKANLIRDEWVKEGATVIDVGINRLAGGSLRGDMNFEGARRRAAWITPVRAGSD